MKVKIGRYLNWRGPYQIADLLQKVGVSEDTCYKIGEWLSNTFVNDLCEWIHSKSKRKISIHIDEWDTWSMDHTLAMIILPMLKQLKATKHGIPSNLVMYDSDSDQSCFEFYKEGDDAAFKSAEQEWDKIMDKMIWSFEQLLDDDNDKQFWIEEPIMDLDNMKSENGVTKMKWKQLGKYDMEASKKHEAMIREGLELFGKYYRALWD